MRRLLVVFSSAVLFWATPASADEEVVRLLTGLSEKYMGHLDRKEFSAIRGMLDPEYNQRVPEDTSLNAMSYQFGKATIFYGRPKVAITSQASATVSVKITYFSNDRIETGCQQIYWVLRNGEWFISHHNPRLSENGGCIS